jgi:hypothetical protein
MALGPKAMGEAIIANLKAKTGKTLSQWEAELERAAITDPAAARQFLKDLGLGQFQAVAVVEHHFSLDLYADERRLVNDHFERFPEQRALYEEALESLVAKDFKPQPCRSYLPVYFGGKIAVSFKPTKRGLYAALNLANPSKWPDRVAHKLSLGGSARLKDGVYLSARPTVKRLISELESGA